MMTIDDIQRSLPHRYPMLLVDRVVEYQAPDTLAAIKAITVAEPWYDGVDGDADGAFEYPCFLLVESWCQTAALLAQSEHRGEGTPLLGRLSGVSFQVPVLPGDVVKHRVRLLYSTPGAAVLSGDALVAQETVLTVGSVVVAFRESPLPEGGSR